MKLFPGWCGFLVKAMLCMACLTALFFNSFAGDFKPSVTEVTHDTEMFQRNAQNSEVVWWLPGEFWQATFDGDPDMSADRLKELVETVKPYVVVAVARAKMGHYGNVLGFDSEDALRTNIFLIDGKNNRYAPLEYTDLGPDMQRLSDLMKPLIAKATGSMQEGIVILVFPGKDKADKVFNDPTKSGGFSLLLGKDTFRWRLPLSSAVPPKTCPHCHEVLNGGFSFCPYDGTALTK